MQQGWASLPSAALPQDPLTPFPDRLGDWNEGSLPGWVIIYPSGIPGSAEPLFPHYSPHP